MVKATSGANGSYTISGVGPGFFKITEVLKSGWTQTKGGLGRGGPYVVTTNSGVNVSGDDFGNFKDITVSGVVFYDKNANGVRDAGEPGLSGWVIRVIGENTVLTATTRRERHVLHLWGRPGFPDHHGSPAKRLHSDFEESADLPDNEWRQH